MSNWQADLFENTKRRGLRGAVIAVLSAPSFRAVLLLRATIGLRKLGLPGKIFSSLARQRAVHSYGCFFSPLAIVGQGLRLPHPTSIIIGDGVKIGDFVTLYHNVTLGRRVDEDGRYPVIEDRAQVYTGAVIIGNVTIGEGAIVGANSVVTRDVPPYTTVVGSPAKPIGSAKASRASER